MEETTHFFADMKSVPDFTAVTQSEGYVPLPADWFIVITDVKGSTRAIQDGAYKNVNMVGAACIMGILNVAGDIDIPYVFGGDGATLAIPPQLHKPVQEFLVRMRSLAAEHFGLSLRIGILPVRDLLDAGHAVNVLKYQMSPNTGLAMFSGGGLMAADHLLKQETDNPYLIPEDMTQDGPPDLEGLSCRWEPLQSQNGKILCLLVCAPYGTADDKAVLYGEILAKLDRILGHDIENFRPTSNQTLRFRWPPRGLWTEAKMTANGKNILATYLGLASESLLQYFLEKTGRKAGSYNAPIYKKELLANTDFQRFDDMIRLVLDCRYDQISAIEDMLRPYFEEGKIAFGTHQSGSALMTCLVFNLAESAHLHFVDGGDGGFALAAIGMKKQLASLAEKAGKP